MEFSPCQACNAQTSLSEQIAAFYIRITDAATEHFHEDDLNKLISAVANNAPELLPTFDLSTNEKRRAMREQGRALPPGETFSNAPVVSIPPGVNPHLELFGRKLLAAIHYRETGRVLGPEQALIVQWAQLGSPAADISKASAAAWFGDPIVGARRNEDLGFQLTFRHGHHERHGFLGLWAEFGLAFGFFCVAGPRDQLRELQNGWVVPFIPLDELGAGLKRRA